MKIYRKHILITLGIVALLAAVAAVMYYSRPYHKKIATIPSSTSVGSPVNAPPSSQNSNGNNSSQSSGSNASASEPSQATLITPWGNFVSNHHPGEGGSPSSETSTCNTTPGATCYIRFTNGTKTRNLGSKIANANGAVIWNWDVNAAGFSSGSWQVTAIATLNGQTKSANDSLALLVQ